jgi:fructokinase
MKHASAPRIGIDLGGTKIEIAALSPSGETLYQHRVLTPKGDYAAGLACIAQLIENAESALDARATIGIGMPGSLSPASNLVRNANSTWLNGKPLSEDLQRLTGRELRFANDANCFALSEARDGAGVDASSVFGVILGTGCGGGIVIDGKLLTSANAVAGEWGHNPLPWLGTSERPEPSCWCGRTGCNELWLSGSGIERDHVSVTGNTLSAESISGLAQSGDVAATATLSRHASRLGRGLASVINLLDPDVIVLGGGLSKMTHLYEQLPGLMMPFVFSDVLTTKIAAPVHGDASGVRGAAWLWDD